MADGRPPERGEVAAERVHAVVQVEDLLFVCRLRTLFCLRRLLFSCWFGRPFLRTFFSKNSCCFFIDDSLCLQAEDLLHGGLHFACDRGSPARTSPEHCQNLAQRLGPFWCHHETIPTHNPSLSRHALRSKVQANLSRYSTSKISKIFII